MSPVMGGIPFEISNYNVLNIFAVTRASEARCSTGYIVIRMQS